MTPNNLLKFRLAKHLRPLAAACVLAFASPSLAEHVCEHCQRIDAHDRAGSPLCVAPWARPSFGCHETGCYVGGGAPFRGDARCPHEGTWGWDYHGRLFNKRIWLGWHHGRRDQGGYGAYKTEGPRLVHH